MQASLASSALQSSYLCAQHRHSSKFTTLCNLFGTNRHSTLWDMEGQSWHLVMLRILYITKVLYRNLYCVCGTNFDRSFVGSVLTSTENKLSYSKLGALNSNLPPVLKLDHCLPQFWMSLVSQICRYRLVHFRQASRLDFRRIISFWGHCS